MRQLALDVQLADHAVFASFHAGPNALAIATLRTMVAGEGPHSAWLWGPRDAGKSHLLQAAVAEAHGCGAPTAYLPLAVLAGMSASVLDGMGGLRVVALDDLAAVAGDPEWERALLRLFEQLMAGGGRLLMAAGAPPAGSGIVLADLRSRFTAAAVFRLEPLSEADCRQALRRRAEWRGLDLPDETADFLLARVERHGASLFRLLDRLDRAALAAQRRLTVPFVRSVLESGD